ncbi:MAG: RICIN domain-containing protein [Oscillospiraceae bacterium]|nr:RICIN domain-containing protein [Oscillospiraceae bacterium]
MKKHVAAIIIMLILLGITFAAKSGVFDSTTSPETSAPTTPAAPAPATQEAVKAEPLQAGTYAFLNRETGLYLSYRDGSLILSDSPANWILKEFSNQVFYVYAHDTDLLLDIDNAHVVPGKTIKLWTLTGYDVQRWCVEGNTNGTYSILYSGDNQFCLGFEGENAQLQLRSADNGMQEWEAIDMSATLPKAYLSYESTGGIIELQLPLDILSVISEARLLQWANELEIVYHTYYELTGFIPYGKIIVEAYRPCEHFAYVTENCNIIRFNSAYIYDEMAKMAARDCDWNFCLLHEMGHMFDCQRPWNFEAEVMTDFKLAYVLEKNGAAAAPAEFSASEVFYGADIINAYDRLGSGFSQRYDIFSIAKRFLEIKNVIGWEPFIATFHHMQENEAAYAGATKLQRLENFVSLVSSYSGTDIKTYFTADEWNTIISQIGG